MVITQFKQIWKDKLAHKLWEDLLKLWDKVFHFSVDTGEDIMQKYIHILKKSETSHFRFKVFFF